MDNIDAKSSPLRDLGKIRRTARQQAETEEFMFTEGIGDQKVAWAIYDNVEGYDVDFQPVLHKSIAAFLGEKRQQLGHAFAMDAMGQGRFYALGNLDGEVAMTLVDGRTEEQKAADDAHNKIVVLGDIFSPEPRIAVDQYLKDHEGDMNGGFDLITCRPIGAWNNILPERTGNPRNQSPRNTAMEHVLANTLFRWLSPENGALCMRMYATHRYGDWFKILNETHGITAESYGSILRITRTSAEARQLPRMPQIRRK